MASCDAPSRCGAPARVVIGRRMEVQLPAEPTQWMPSIDGAAVRGRGDVTTYPSVGQYDGTSTVVSVPFKAAKRGSAKVTLGGSRRRRRGSTNRSCWISTANRRTAGGSARASGRLRRLRLLAILWRHRLPEIGQVHHALVVGPPKKSPRVRSCRRRVGVAGLGSRRRRGRWIGNPHPSVCRVDPVAAALVPPGRKLDDLRHRRHGRGGRNCLDRGRVCRRDAEPDWGRIVRGAPARPARRGGVAVVWRRVAVERRPATESDRKWYHERPERPRVEERLSHEGGPEKGAAEEGARERVASGEDVPSCSAESAESHREGAGRRRQACCDDCKENAEYLREPPHRHATLP